MVIQENSDKYMELDKKLMRRYEECNTPQGHRKPHTEDNYCTHCYRPLEWKTPETEAILAFRKDLPLMQIPMDAPRIHKVEQEEIALQKSLQRFKGLRMLEQELEGSLED